MQSPQASSSNQSTSEQEDQNDYKDTDTSNARRHPFIGTNQANRTKKQQNAPKSYHPQNIPHNNRGANIMRDYSEPRDYGITSNKKPLPYERKLKVCTGYYDHQFHNHHPLYRPQEAVPVPRITIMGYWLEEAGFTRNQPLLLKISEGKIVLTVDS